MSRWTPFHSRRRLNLDNAASNRNWRESFLPPMRRHFVSNLDLSWPKFEWGWRRLFAFIETHPRSFPLTFVGTKQNGTMTTRTNSRTCLFVLLFYGAIVFYWRPLCKIICLQLSFWCHWIHLTHFFCLLSGRSPVDKIEIKMWTTENLIVNLFLNFVVAYSRPTEARAMNLATFADLSPLTQLGGNPTKN